MLPRPRTDVPRESVHKIVKLFLINSDVMNVYCIQQSNGRYTVQPVGKGGVMSATVGAVMGTPLEE